jgi:UDP-N-acetyl-D-mannosaminuronic acid dehydrogenase
LRDRRRHGDHEDVRRLGCRHGVCDTLGIDVWSVIKIANLHPRVNILSPGPGVGGHCIPIDPWFIHQAAPDRTPLIKAAREVNDR